MGNSRNLDRLAVATGGSGGIGAHLVRAFARAGHAVTFNYLGEAGRPKPWSPNCAMAVGGGLFVQAVWPYPQGGATDGGSRT